MGIRHTLQWILSRIRSCHLPSGDLSVRARVCVVSFTRFPSVFRTSKRYILCSGSGPSVGDRDGLRKAAVPLGLRNACLQDLRLRMAMLLHLGNILHNINNYTSLGIYFFGFLFYLFYFICDCVYAQHVGR